MKEEMVGASVFEMTSISCMCSFSSFQEHINSCFLEFISQLLWEKVQSCNLIQIQHMIMINCGCTSVGIKTK